MSNICQRSFLQRTILFIQFCENIPKSWVSWGITHIKSLSTSISPLLEKQDEQNLKNWPLFNKLAPFGFSCLWIPLIERHPFISPAVARDASSPSGKFQTQHVLRESERASERVKLPCFELILHSRASCLKKKLHSIHYSTQHAL